MKEVREALLVLAKHADGFSHAFGTKEIADPAKHLIGTAAGANPDRDTTYVGAAVPNNDGKSARWNELVRFYRPRAEILNGKWKFSEPQVVK